MLDELAEQFSARYHPHSGITMLVKNCSCLARIIHTLFTSKAAENNELKTPTTRTSIFCMKMNGDMRNVTITTVTRAVCNELGNECGLCAFYAEGRSDGIR